MKLYRKSSRIMCKVVSVLLALLMLFVTAVPCFAESSQTAGVPDEPFSVEYYDLKEGKDVTTPQFPAVPQTILTDYGRVDVGNYLIYQQRVGDGYEYVLCLFEGEQQPTRVNIEYSFTGMPSEYKDAKEYAEKYHYDEVLWSAISDAWLSEYYGQLTVPLVWEVVFVKRALEIFDGKMGTVASQYSNAWWKNQLLTLTDDAITDIYETAARVDGVLPWLEVELLYDDTPNKSHIAVYVYDEVSKSWRGSNLIRPSNSVVFEFVGVLNMIATSFTFYNSQILTGSKDAFVGIFEDKVESEPVRRPVSSTPSWDSGLGNSNNGGNGDVVGDSFVNGSWYNDGGTGNPFVAAFVAPWIGVNWTYENVASEISLFGVSVADVIATLLLLAVAMFFIVWLAKTLKGG